MTVEIDNHKRMQICSGRDGFIQKKVMREILNKFSLLISSSDGELGEKHTCNS
jgi:hypothetical protein